MDRGLSLCKLCDEPILPGEPVSPSVFDGEPVHLECGFRAVSGGANHLLHLCSCYICGGSMPPDPQDMTKRQAAKWALQVWKWREELRQVMRENPGDR